MAALDGGPPPELLDAKHPVWQSKARTKAWLVDRGLVVGAALDWGPLNRHDASMYAWAKSGGLMKPPMASGYLGFDLVRMREMGLPATGGRGVLREQMEYEGVRFDEAWRDGPAR